MEKKQAMKWVKALLSGKYKQTDGKLKKVYKNGNVKGHCCLGVLAEISKCDQESILAEDLLDNVSMQRQCGINTHDGEARGEEGGIIYFAAKIDGKEKEFSSLADANDEGASFEQIAEYIKKNYQNL